MNLTDSVSTTKEKDDALIINDPPAEEHFVDEPAKPKAKKEPKAKKHYCPNCEQSEHVQVKNGTTYCSDCKFTYDIKSGENLTRCWNCDRSLEHLNLYDNKSVGYYNCPNCGQSSLPRNRR